MTRYVGIDPSTKTGIVALSPSGRTLDAREIEGKGEDPRRMYSIIQAVSRAIQPDDIICIEDFGFSSQKAVILGGIGWGIRMELYRRGFKYIQVAPKALKKFTGAGGNANKEQVADGVFNCWGLRYKSDNVTDAYVLAQIARAMHENIKTTKFQQEVINVIRNPQPKSKKKKEKKIG